MTKQEKYFAIISTNYNPDKSFTQNGFDLASKLGVSPRTARSLISNYCRVMDAGTSTINMVNTKPSITQIHFFGDKEASESTAIELEDIKTAEELLAYAEVDTDKFKIRSQKLDKTASGKLTVSVTLDSVEEESNIKTEIQELLDAWTYQRLNQDIVYTIQAPEKEDDNLLVINCFDVHFGKVSNPEITGQEYNLDIARELFIDTITRIATRAVNAYGISEVVLCTGGDFFNSDTVGYTTTGGTQQHGDGNSYQKVFTEGCNAVIEVLEILVGLVPKVKFININGNHDRLTSYCLGEVVNAYFHNNSKIEVDNSPHLRKYYSFGESCFMFTHGDKAVDRLPLIFAREYKQFSLHTFPNIFLGHYHKTDKKFFGGETEYNGVNVRTFNSISAADAWHHDEGYVESIRKADGLIYSRTEGKIGEINQVIKHVQKEK